MATRFVPSEGVLPLFFFFENIVYTRPQPTPLKSGPGSCAAYVRNHDTPAETPSGR
jgi:hypothetical protein